MGCAAEWRWHCRNRVCKTLVHTRLFDGAKILFFIKHEKCCFRVIGAACLIPLSHMVARTILPLTAFAAESPAGWIECGPNEESSMTVLPKTENKKTSIIVQLSSLMDHTTNLVVYRKHQWFYLHNVIL